MVGASEDGIITIAQLKFILNERMNGLKDRGGHGGRIGFKTTGID